MRHRIDNYETNSKTYSPINEVNKKILNKNSIKCCKI